MGSDSISELGEIGIKLVFDHEMGSDSISKMESDPISGTESDPISGLDSRKAGLRFGL